MLNLCEGFAAPPSDESGFKELGQAVIQVQADFIITKR